MPNTKIFVQEKEREKEQQADILETRERTAAKGTSRSCDARHSILTERPDRSFLFLPLCEPIVFLGSTKRNQIATAVLSPQWGTLAPLWGWNTEGQKKVTKTICRIWEADLVGLLKPLTIKHFSSETTAAWPLAFQHKQKTSNSVPFWEGKRAGFGRAFSDSA